jgi:hypothetical protein
MRRRIVVAVAAAAAGLLLTVWAFNLDGDLQRGFISVAGDPTGHNRDAFEFRIYDDASESSRPFGRFIYGEELDTPSLDAPAGWVAGDRVAYRCGWAFLTYRNWIVGRVTYTSIGGPNEAGAFVNDAFMLEGQRHYDGRADPEIGTGDDNERQFGDECTNPPSGDRTRAAGPAPRWPTLPMDFEFGASPVIVFHHGPHDIEVRDFADVDDVTKLPHPDLRLRIAAQTERRVTVVGYERQPDGWVPRLEVHFDVMVPGGIVPETQHPVEIQTTHRAEL